MTFWHYCLVLRFRCATASLPSLPQSYLIFNNSSSIVKSAMLSIPVKSAKRLSSLFSLGSSKDNSDQDVQVSRQSALQKAPPPHETPVRDQRQLHPQQNKTSTGRSLRHATSAQHLSANSLGVLPSNRNVSAPLPAQEPANDNDGILLPPPPLNTLNADLSDSTSERRMSWSGGLSNMATGFSRPASRSGLFSAVNTDPKSSKGRSWLPGKGRLSSVDLNQREPSMRAWIAGRDIEYDINPLLNGEKVSFDLNLLSGCSSAKYPDFLKYPFSYRLMNYGMTTRIPLYIYSRKMQTEDLHSRLIPLSLYHPQFSLSWLEVQTQPLNSNDVQYQRSCRSSTCQRRGLYQYIIR